MLHFWNLFVVFLKKRFGFFLVLFNVIGTYETFENEDLLPVEPHFGGLICITFAVCDFSIDSHSVIIQ